MTGIETNQKRENIFWNYFLALETDLLNISRYIDFCEHNKDTYSIELTKLLLASSSEVDVVLKELCNIVHPNSGSNNIIQYYDVLSSDRPDLFDCINKEWVYLDRFSLKFQPWLNWEMNGNCHSSPNWWTSNNHVKHRRFEKYYEATLYNTINSLSALFVILYYFHTEKFKISNSGQTITRYTIMSLFEPESQVLSLNPNYYPGYTGTILI